MVDFVPKGFRNANVVGTTGSRLVNVCMAAYGHCHEDTLMAKENLAMIYATCKRWSEEEKLREEIVAARSAWQGEESTHTIMAMGGLARTYWNRACWEQAEILFSRVVQTISKFSGEHDAKTAAAKANLAAV